VAEAVGAGELDVTGALACLGLISLACRASVAVEINARVRIVAAMHFALVIFIKEISYFAGV
jgi:hypothetical protein